MEFSGLKSRTKKKSKKEYGTYYQNVESNTRQNNTGELAAALNRLSRKKTRNHTPQTMKQNRIEPYIGLI